MHLSKSLLNLSLMVMLHSQVLFESIRSPWLRFTCFLYTESPSSISSDLISPVTDSSAQENSLSVPNASDDLHLVSRRLTRPSPGVWKRRRTDDRDKMLEIWWYEWLPVPWWISDITFYWCCHRKSSSNLRAIAKKISNHPSLILLERSEKNGIQWFAVEDYAAYLATHDKRLALQWITFCIFSKINGFYALLLVFHCVEFYWQTDLIFKFSCFVFHMFLSRPTSKPVNTFHMLCAVFVC